MNRALTNRLNRIQRPELLAQKRLQKLKAKKEFAATLRVVQGDLDVKPGSDEDRKLNQPEGNENG